MRFLTPQQLYSSAAGEAALRRLYATTLAALPFPHEERWVQTAFGRVHVVVCGPSDGRPLLLWHGATAPAPFVLCAPSLRPLVARFRVYCPDLPCHGELLLLLLLLPLPLALLLLSAVVLFAAAFVREVGGQGYRCLL